MDIYQTEDEQVEALKKWWRENGKSAIYGVVLGVLAIFGWREWQDYQTERTIAASRLYQEMIIAARDNRTDVASEKASDLVARFESTAYAVFARLEQAKIAVTAGKLEDARGSLQWALDHSSEASLQHVIRLRLARVLMAQEQFTDAKSVLGKATQKGEFAAAYAELEADILRAEGDMAAAREAYLSALNTARDLGQDTDLLELKLDDLGRSEVK